MFVQVLLLLCWARIQCVVYISDEVGVRWNCHKPSNNRKKIHPAYDKLETSQTSDHCSKKGSFYHCIKTLLLLVRLQTQCCSKVAQRYMSKYILTYFPHIHCCAKHTNKSLNMNVPTKPLNSLVDLEQTTWENATQSSCCQESSILIWVCLYLYRRVGEITADVLVLLVTPLILNDRPND